MLESIIGRLGPYLDCKSTLKNTSYDSAKQHYMTQSTYSVFNFDNIKNKYLRGLESKPAETPCSNDALVHIGSELYFIEFKNGAIDNVENYELKQKILESLLILLSIINETIDFTRHHVSYILVYNNALNHRSKFYTTESAVVNSTPSRYAIISATARKAGKNVANFDLERYKSIYFQNVYTYSETEFKSEFTGKFLDC